MKTKSSKSVLFHFILPTRKQRKTGKREEKEKENFPLKNVFYLDNKVF
jgi:hypothetical protein